MVAPMDRKYVIVAIIAIVLLTIGAAIGSDILTINLGTTEETDVSIFSTTSGYSVKCVGQPSEFKVVQYGVDPYAGPYSYHWDFGDGSFQEGSDNATHMFTNPGIYHVQVFVSGNDDWNDVLEFGQITILAKDAFSVSILNMGNCDWNETYAGNKYLNFTVWNNSTFPVEVCKYSFGLCNATGDYFPVVNNQTDSYSNIQAGGNLTWTVFYAQGEGDPVKLSYFDLFEWSIDWKEE